MAQHVEQLERRIARLDQHLLEGLHPWGAGQYSELRAKRSIPLLNQQSA